jgi:hypothetical protein
VCKGIIGQDNGLGVGWRVGRKLVEGELVGGGMEVEEDALSLSVLGWLPAEQLENGKGTEYEICSR